jgi:chromate transporter
MNQVQLAPSAKTQDIFTTFLKLGLTSFGGPVAHLNYFRKDLVESRAWLTEHDYAAILSLCQSAFCAAAGPAASPPGPASRCLRRR